VALADTNRTPVNGMLAGVSGNTGGAEEIHLGANVRTYCNVEELLAEPDIHLVSLCTPTRAHASQAIAALRAGKHVVCEKPLARSGANARTIVDAARTAPGYLMPAMTACGQRVSHRPQIFKPAFSQRSMKRDPKID